MTDNPETLTLEEALRELNTIVQQLEDGDSTLDESLELFERGQALVRRCQADLEAKDLRIQQILDDDSLAPLR